VTFLVRAGSAPRLRERGLRVVGLGQEQVTRPRLVSLQELSDEFEIVLLSVKGTGLDAAIDDVAPAIGPHTTIVPFLNGIAQIDALTTRFGAEAVLGGVVKVATTVNDEGDIVVLAPFARIAIGELDRRPSVRLQAVFDGLANAGFEMVIEADIVAAMWHKWVLITTVGALTCLLRGAVGEVVAVPGGNAIGPAILAEGSAVAAAAGYPLPASELDSIGVSVTEPGSPLTASPYRDVVAGRPTEVEHVFGDLIARARSLAVPTPLLDLATAQLRVHQARVTATSR
jgi:2-dehydropantoate 2-reductase